ncbi:MAG: ribokinase [Ectobacillus sp.]
MASIAVVGSSSIDLVAVSDKRPKAGETVIGSAFHTVPGGKGANQAVAAARLGARVAMVGAVGEDAYGKAILENFERERVFIPYVVPVTGTTTGTAHIVLAEGDNSIVVVPGANGLVDRHMVDRAKQVLIEADIVLVQLEIPLDTVQYVLDVCDEHHVPVVLNPAPAQALPADMIEKAAYLTPNEHECRVIFNDFETPLEELLAKYPNKLLMTEGEQGVRFHNGTDIVRVPGISVEVVDTTGAGDTFNGALAVALAEGKALPEAIAFANRAAGISVTKLGAQGGMPTRETLHELQVILGEETRNA